MTTIIGLTGSIGTGKSVTTKMFRRLGIPVQDSDAVVHDLLANDSDVHQDIIAHFPDAVYNGIVNRHSLREIIFQNTEALRTLEGILHPRVRQHHMNFIKLHQHQKTPLIVLDIPLLFERGWDTLCSLTIAMNCSTALQRERVLRRPGMTEAFYDYIIVQQWSTINKCQRATFVLDSNHGFVHTFKQLKKELKSCR